MLYCGPASRGDADFVQYELEVDVGNVTQYEVEVPDTWGDYHFTVVAYRMAGPRSDYSEEVSAHRLTGSPEGQGTVTPATVVVPAGSPQTFAFVADPGHYVSGLIVDGQERTPATSHTFVDVRASHNLAVRFEPNAGPAVHTIVATPGPHGSLAPAGTLTVSRGSTVTFHADPDTNYEVAGWDLDGQPASNAETFTLADVASDHTVGVLFRKIPRSINVSSKGKGSVRPRGRTVAKQTTGETPLSAETVVVGQGEDVTFDILPAAGHETADVTVDGQSVGVATSYGFTNVQADHSLAATFVAIDLDRNNIADAWEQQYFGATAVDPNGDPDGDGVSNLMEYQNGTDPTMADLDGTLAPVVSRPISGGTVVTLMPVLRVRNTLAPPESPLVYEFQVGLDPALSSLVAGAVGVGEGEGETDWRVQPALSNRTRYFWRARATDGQLASPWTETATFLVDLDGQETTVATEVAEPLPVAEETILEVTDTDLVSHGIVVDVPIGAVDQDQILTLGPVTNAPTASGETRILGRVFDFGPHGVPLAAKATIMLPYTQGQMDTAGVTSARDLGLVTYNTKTLRWESLPVEAVDYAGKRLVCRVSHFSMYAIGLTPDPGAEDSIVLTSPAEEGGSGGGGGCFLGVLGSR